MVDEKTPVTILQELMAKIGTIPRYEQCSDKAANNLNFFKYSVTCDSVTTHGEGRSKREAKHNAANAMLEKLKNSQIESKPSVQNNGQAGIVQPLKQNISSENSPAEKSIQHLQTLCSKYKLKAPVYTELKPTGPAHAFTFNINCRVSTFTVSGSGKTKKQAKHVAAKNMIEQINNIFYGVSSNNNGSNDAKIVKKQDDNSSTFSKDYQNNGTADSTELKINYDLKLESNRAELSPNLKSSNLLSNLEKISVIIRKCQENICLENVTQVKQEFQHVLELAKIDFHHMLLQTLDPETFMLIIQLNTVPDILEMSLGGTREEAELRTIGKVIETLKKFDK